MQHSKCWHGIITLFIVISPVRVLFFRWSQFKPQGHSSAKSHRVRLSGGDMFNWIITFMFKLRNTG